ncbi:cysteine proteinase, partial [Neoconidiobolus thromboides FSU 785]
AILLSYQDSVIRSVDLASLSTNSWITDSIIHFYYTYLEATSPSPEISLLSPSIIHLFLMLNRNHTSHEELITILPRSLVTCNFLFLPINNHRQITTGGTHWSLLIYSKLDECFFYYDSLRDSNYHYAKEVASYIIKLLNVKLCKIRCMNTPQQWNGSDCGVFLLILSEILYFRL